MNLQQQNSPSRTISRTLKTAKLIDAFWERWLVHGVDFQDVQKVRSNLTTLDQWLSHWESLAQEKLNEAKNLELQSLTKEAEFKYRQTALYYYLNYWINPEYSENKQNLYKKCLTFFKKADALSEIETQYKTIRMGGNRCAGRIRIPENPKGCILIINPIDSSKEELFSYEKEFVDEGLITLSFDGPGQGETFILNGVIGSREAWESFTNQLIEYTKASFANLPIFLFGTSLGASWVLYGSSSINVTKAVAVSPAIELEKMNMPSYFMERINYSCKLDEKEIPIPNFKEISYHSPVLIAHGKKDMMISDQEMYHLLQSISSEKYFIEYEDEGHVCNNKLDEIRKTSLKWFSEAD